MEELRALVRKWNLHHKRNFWRENPTKDDVVAALNRHIKRVKVVHDNIESKRAERREADRKRQAQNASGDGNFFLKAVLSSELNLRVEKNPSLSYQGCALPRLRQPHDSDFPVDAVETGLIYMSRWSHENPRNEVINEGTDGALVHADTKNESKTAPVSASEANLGGSGDASNSSHTMYAQEQFSLALLNMTMRDQVL